MGKKVVKWSPRIYGPKEYASGFRDPDNSCGDKSQKETFSYTRIFMKSVKSVAIEYMQNTTISGYKNVVEPNRHRIEKIIWITVMLSMLTGVIMITVTQWINFLKHPTVVSFESSTYPIWEVPYPTVTICSVNKISARKAREYARNLSLASGKPEEEIFKNIHYLGRFYDLNIKNFDRLRAVTKFIDKYDKDFDPYDTLFKLAPSCDKMLALCLFKSFRRNCNEIFFRLMTAEGLCCVFNLAISSIGLNKSAQILQAPGENAGLQVILNPELDDYLFPIHSSEGFDIRMSNPTTFPDIYSGRVATTFVRADHENRITIEPTTMRSENEVRNYNKESRGCYYRNDLPELLGNEYTFSNCISICRAQEIMAICDCVPFYYKPLNYTTRLCNLHDMHCLHKHRDKFHVVFLTEVDIYTQVDYPLGLHCPKCRPDCTTTMYKVKTTYIPSHMNTGGFLNEFTTVNQATKNRSHFYAYYQGFNGYLYKLDVYYYWFEIVSNAGGICSLFMGISLISIAEFIMYCTVKLFFKLKENGFFIWRV